MQLTGCIPFLGSYNEGTQSSVFELRNNNPVLPDTNKDDMPSYASYFMLHASKIDIIVVWKVLGAFVCEN